jgi:hypothetical protein
MTMIPYTRRLQSVATAPKDIVAVNARLMSGDISPEEAAEQIVRLDDSWQGVRGSFDNESRKCRVVSVGSFVIRQVALFPGLKALDLQIPQPRHISGRLEGLRVVETDFSYIHEGRADPPYEPGHVIAAELHFPDNEPPTNSAVSLAYLAISIPYGSYQQLPAVFSAGPTA